MPRSRSPYLQTDELWPSNRKIADCLTSIDDQLNAQARKLDTLKQHKQGLLQQLFPSLDGQ